MRGETFHSVINFRRVFYFYGNFEERSKLTHENNRHFHIILNLNRELTFHIYYVMLILKQRQFRVVFDALEYVVNFPGFET